MGPDGIAIPRAHTPRDHVQIEFRKQQKLIRRSVRLPAQEKKWLSHIPTYPLSFWALVGRAHSTEPLTLRPIDPPPSVRWIFKINGPYHMVHNLSWECMHPISYMFDVCMYVWMHGNDACQVD